LGFSEQSVAAFLASVAAPTPAPGGGASTATACALAAALVEMAGGISGREDVAASGAAARERAARLADEDAAAYGEVIDAQRAGDPAEISAALSRASDIPLEIAETAAGMAELAAEMADTGRASLRGDAIAGALLAEAAAAAAVRLVEINLRDTPGDSRLGRARELTQVAADARRRAISRD
jgi:formiminotetrahydrofolate cyclodeaminase